MISNAAVEVADICPLHSPSMEFADGWLTARQLERKLRFLLLDVTVPCALFASVFVVRAFVRLRSIYASHIELTRRLDELGTKVSQHSQDLRAIVEALRQLMNPSRSHSSMKLLP